MRVLVTGGAGYIGSTVCHYLKAAGHEVVVADDAEGWEPECDEFHSVYLHHGDGLNYIESVDVVVHLAALIEVGESVKDPIRYYDNNIGSLCRVVAWMKRSGVTDIVYASSAAVYGDKNGSLAISETANTDPVNPYGLTKDVGEHLLQSCLDLGHLRFVTLRLFNVAGWDPHVERGENHRPETHLIPLAIQAAMGHGKFEIYGGDYNTKDGTCLRDYVHVTDVARAFLTAAENTFELAGETFNIASGVGSSVRDVLNVVEEVVGQRVDWPIKDRRLGDPVRLIADIERAMRLLGWKPQLTLRQMIESAYEWEKKRWKAT